MWFKAVLEHTYFTFFSDFKKMTYVFIDYQKVVKSLAKVFLQSVFPLQPPRQPEAALGLVGN